MQKKVSTDFGMVIVVFVVVLDSEAPVNTNKVNGVQRRGVFNAAESYHGISDKYYYMTPAEFYSECQWLCSP